MMNSIMARKALKAVLIPLFIFAFWIGVWYLSCAIISNDYLLPTPHSTLLSLLNLLLEPSFYKVVLFSFSRVLLGVLLGVVSGIALAFLSNRFSLIKRTLSPIISVIKATPVVTFITLLWIILNGNALAIFIAFLMVMPIVWQNLLNGYDAIPKELSEVCEIFNFSRYKRFKILIFPILMQYLFPAVVTSVGLAWKAEIAAEIIAYTKVSIGQYIYDARYNLMSDRVFAWVAVIVVFSIALELLTKKILRRLEK